MQRVVAFICRLPRIGDEEERLFFFSLFAFVIQHVRSRVIELEIVGNCYDVWTRCLHTYRKRCMVEVPDRMTFFEVLQCIELKISFVICESIFFV